MVYFKDKEKKKKIKKKKKEKLMQWIIDLCKKAW